VLASLESETTMKNLLPLLAACLWLAAGGCAQFDMRKNIPWGESVLGGEPEAPLRVVGMWTNTVMHQGDLPARRGFGGRVMFFGEDGEPVQVEGTLVVYAFEEAPWTTVKQVPDRKFVFTAEQVPEHYSESPAGHSYSFWLPWDEAGGRQNEVSLIARFTSKSGGVVISEQSRVLLPGPIPPETLQAMQRQADQPTPQFDGARRASYQTSLASTGARAGQTLKTTTIELPRQYGGKLPVAAPGRIPRPTRPQPPATNHQSPTTNPQPPTTNHQPPTTAMGRAAERHFGPQPRARFSLERHRALGAPLAGLDRGRARSTLSPAGWPSAPAVPPQSASPVGFETSAAAAP
jgi:hypothetical protein